MKITITSLCLLLSLIMTGQAAFEENFESKTTGLNLTTDGYVLSQSSTYTGTVTATVNEASGNKFGRMIGNPGGAARMQIAKTITVTEGKSYSFTAESKGPFKRQLRIYSTTDEILQTSADYKPSTTQENNEWKEMTVSFYVPYGTTQVKIAFYHYWSGTIDLDNFKVFEIERQSEYYVSSSGDDSNSGKIDAPFQTLNKISNTSLFPGDKVYFNKGDEFIGRFVVNGSGIANNPIVITSYGTGNQPILNGAVGASGGGDYEEAILISNQDNITIEDIEVRNDRTVTRNGVDDTDAYGINILNDGEKVLRNFIIRNVTVKDVFAVQPILDRDDFDAIAVSGIRFRATKNTEVGKEKNIENILIEDSYFANIQRFGINFRHNGGDTGVGNDEINRLKDITVRNNEFYYNGGTGVLPNGTYNCLIENNLFDHPGATTDPRMPGRGSSIWNINCINTVMQYNTCLSTRGYLDSHGIHIDNFNTNTFVQYNYMEDCEGGFVEILRGNTNAVYRFNVSVNDGWRVNPTWDTSNHTIWVNAVRHNPTTFQPNNHIYIHNNTVVINKPFVNRTFTSIKMDATNLFVYNNIFSSTGGGPSMGGSLSIQPKSKTGTDEFISNNFFEGNVNPDFKNYDANPISGSPQFYGSGEQKISYQLDESSTAINNGLNIQSPILPGAGTGVFQNLTAYPSVDFYGNPIDLTNGSTNIGAYNGKTNADILNTKDVNSAENNWLVYPNADKSKLIITRTSSSLASDKTNISLISIRGQVVSTQEFKSDKEFGFKLDASISNGIYVLNIDEGSVKHSRKIVLSR